MATRFQDPDTVTQIDAILLRIPELTAELVTAVVRVPLLAAELAFSIIAVPSVAAQVIAGLLVHAAEKLDGFVDGTLNTRPTNHGLGTIGPARGLRSTLPQDRRGPEARFRRYGPCTGLVSGWARTVLCPRPSRDSDERPDSNKSQPSAGPATGVVPDRWKISGRSSDYDCSTLGRHARRGTIRICSIRNTD